VHGERCGCGGCEGGEEGLDAWEGLGGWEVDLLEGGLFGAVFFVGEGEFGPFVKDFCGLFVMWLVDGVFVCWKTLGLDC
jgi:hypothetical protein